MCLLPLFAIVFNNKQIESVRQTIIHHFLMMLWLITVTTDIFQRAPLLPLRLFSPYFLSFLFLK